MMNKQKGGTGPLPKMKLIIQPGQNCKEFTDPDRPVHQKRKTGLYLLPERHWEARDTRWVLSGAPGQI